MTEQLVRDLGSEAQTPQELYSVKDVVRLWTASYRHSRGEPGLQTYIFGFFGFHCGSKLTRELINDAILPFTEVAGRIIYKSGVHPPRGNTLESNTGISMDERILKEINARKKNFVDATRNSSSGRRWHAHNSLSSLVDADENWIPHSRDDFDWTSTPQARRYKSNFVEYGLLGRSTGMEEMDAFYRSCFDAYRDLDYDSPAHMEVGRSPFSI